MSLLPYLAMLELRYLYFLEFSHQTKTVYVGGLEDGIDDPELKAYFSEFGFVTRALR